VVWVLHDLFSFSLQCDGSVSGERKRETARETVALRWRTTLWWTSILSLPHSLPRFSLSPCVTRTIGRVASLLCARQLRKKGSTSKESVYEGCCDDLQRDTQFSLLQSLSRLSLLRPKGWEIEIVSKRVRLGKTMRET
jgi:hypothetical protein